VLAAAADSFDEGRGTLVERIEALRRSLFHRGRVTVNLTADAEGLYWGVQSLMLAMRWHSAKDPAQNGLGLRCVKVEDWPATQSHPPSGSSAKGPRGLLGGLAALERQGAVGRQRHQMSRLVAQHHLAAPVIVEVNRGDANRVRRFPAPSPTTTRLAR
jgi:hypothetical protein